MTLVTNVFFIFIGFGAQQNTLTSLQAPSFGSLGSQAPAANTLFGANKGSLFGASNPPGNDINHCFIRQCSIFEKFDNSLLA